MMSESSNTEANDDNLEKIHLSRASALGNEGAESSEERKKELEKIIRDIKGSLDRLVSTGEMNTKKEKGILEIINDSHKITSKSNPTREDIQIAENIRSALEEMEKSVFPASTSLAVITPKKGSPYRDPLESGENFPTIITTPASETNTNISESERMGLYDIYAKLMLHERGNLRIDPDVKKKQQDIIINDTEKTGYGENLIKENSEKYDKIISTVKAKLEMVVQGGWKYIKKGWNTSTEWTRETVVKYPMSMGLGVAFVASSVRLALAKVGVTLLPDYLVLPIVQGSNFYPDAGSALLRLGAAAASPILALSIARFFSGKLKGWKEQAKNIGATIVPSALFSGLPYVYANSFSLSSMLGIVALPATAYVIFDQLRKWKNWDQAAEETVAQAPRAAGATASPSTSAESETTDEGGGEFPALEKSLKEAFQKNWKKKKEENAELKDPEDQAGWFAQIAKFLNSAEGKKALEEAKQGDVALKRAIVKMKEGEKNESEEESKDEKDKQDIESEIEKNEKRIKQLEDMLLKIKKRDSRKKEIDRLTGEKSKSVEALNTADSKEKILLVMRSANRADLQALFEKFQPSSTILGKTFGKVSGKNEKLNQVINALTKVEGDIKSGQEELDDLDTQIRLEYGEHAKAAAVLAEIRALNKFNEENRNTLAKKSRLERRKYTDETAMSTILTERKMLEITERIASAFAKDHAPKTWKETTMAKLGNIRKEVKTHPFKTIRLAETQYPKSTVAAGVALSMLPFFQVFGFVYLLYRGGRSLIENGKKPSAQPKTAQEKSPTATEGEEKK